MVAAASRALAASLLAGLVGAACPPSGFDTQGALEGGFDLAWYTAEKWYIQQQAPISYLPDVYFHCVTARYELLAQPTALGYNVKVHNYAQNAAGQPLGPVQDICARIANEAEGKLAVAPCFLPTSLAGPYWVEAFNKEAGWALVSGGPPKEPGQDGGCRTGTGTNDSGLWIFTRQQQRDDAVVAQVRDVAAAKGFDLSVLKDVDQTGCAAEVAKAAMVV